jgi:hypothetical protein
MNGRGIMSYADGKRYEVEYELGVEIRRRPLVQVRSQTYTQGQGQCFALRCFAMPCMPTRWLA